MYNSINHHVWNRRIMSWETVYQSESVCRYKCHRLNFEITPLSKNAKQRLDHNTYHIWLNFTSHTHTQRHCINTLLPKQSIWDN